MNELWIIPAAPFAGFLILTLLGNRFSPVWTAVTGVGSIGISMLAALTAGFGFITSPPPGHAYSQHLWTWLSVSGFKPEVALFLDPLSLIMVLVVTGVGFLIHLYSAEFMKGEEGYSRFFAWMNLFVGSMLTLVLADNLLLLYLGWEGVGLCSYLLIGFWYKEPANGYAARKAFVITRVGDTALTVGLFLIFWQLGTLQIQEVMLLAGKQWETGSFPAIAAALLLLGGAVGKSAQLPLQTWLPDAMAGPTPVSALLHAATMVTAGVYLIARMHVIFELAPAVLHLVAVIGAVTLLLAGFSALAQKDLKKILAYSTMSQVGYMFLALGVGAWSAAIFHFMTHAFFKALLFLCAGVIINCLNEEHDISKMGRLRKELPLTFRTFLIGASSLSALPLVTAGFYSKDLILYQALSSKEGETWLWMAGLFGALLTSIYAFRMVFIIFFGEARSRVIRRPGILIKLPIIVLAFLSIVGGFVELPDLHIFTGFLNSVLPAMEVKVPIISESLSTIISGAVSILGILTAFIFFQWRPEYVQRLMMVTPWRLLQSLWYSGWGFDRLYDRLIVIPYVRMAELNKNDFIDIIYTSSARLMQRLAELDKEDFIDLIYTSFAGLMQLINSLLIQTQTGKVRLYATGIAMGGIVIMGMVIFL